MPVFQITSHHISLLGDADLRELVARLCEAELRASSDSVSAVRWGGSHTAPDGGLDVEVLLSSVPKAPDFIQRHHTGFQVKKPKMPTSRILAEMRPQGVLRPIIHKLGNL